MEFDIGEYCPKLYVSIVAHGIYPDPMRVLVQNVLLCKENVGWLVRKIKLRLEILENDWAEHANMDQSTFDTAHEKYGTQGVHLESCMHVLSLMPEDAAALIVLVSDGVAELPYTTSYDDVFMKLARRDIQCHVAMVCLIKDFKVWFNSCSLGMDIVQTVRLGMCQMYRLWNTWPR